MASVFEGDVNRALDTLQKLVSDDSGGLPKPLPRLSSLDEIVSRVLAPKSASELRGCKPWDYNDFLRRARTFKATLWFAKPEELSPLRCSRYGWLCNGRDALVCSVCGAVVIVKEPIEGDPEKLLNESHKGICPWREDPCPTSFLDFQYLSDADCLQQLKSRMQAFAAVPSAKLAEAHVEAQPDSLSRVVVETVDAQNEASRQAVESKNSTTADLSLEEFLADEFYGEFQAEGAEQSSEKDKPETSESERDLMPLFFRRVFDCLKMDGGDPSLKIAAAFAMYGWDPVEELECAGQELSPGGSALLVLECKVCGAVVRLRSSPSSEQLKGGRAKRRKRYPRVHPEHSHRVWCPLVHTESNSAPGYVYGVRAVLNNSVALGAEGQENTETVQGRQNGETTGQKLRKDSPASKLADTYRRIRGMLDET